MEYKLNFELVPDSVWGSNLRSILKPSMWDVVRRDAYARAHGRCMICLRPAKRLEAHERWDYNLQTHTQTLVDVVGICHDCHQVIHIGRTQLVGDIDRAIDHFLKVNNCTYPDYVKALKQANLLHQERNKVGEWALDLSWLKRFT